MWKIKLLFCTCEQLEVVKVTKDYLIYVDIILNNIKIYEQKKFNSSQTTTSTLPTLKPVIMKQIIDAFGVSDVFSLPIDHSS